MAKDTQSESSKLDQKNAEMDKAQEEGYKRYQKQEIEDNQAPRKAVGKAVDFVKKGLGMTGDSDRQRKHTESLHAEQEQQAKARGMSLKEYIRSEATKSNKKLKEDTDPGGYKKGGKVSSASKRADGCAVRGKTRGKMY